MNIYQNASNNDINQGSKIEYNNQEGHGFNNRNNENRNWEFQNNEQGRHEDGGVLDPENFLSTEKNLLDDFAMNIIPSEPDFMGHKGSDADNSLENHIMNLRSNWDKDSF